MSLLAAARARYTTKTYDPARTLPQAQVDELLGMLRYSPSSVNSQPWHFVVASDAAGKARLAKGAHGTFAANEPKVLNASHVVLFCARNDMTPGHLDALLAQEEKDGRFPNPEAKAGQHKGRSFYLNIHRWDQKDVQHWMEKQVYLSLGTLLLGAATLGIDATPMEGLDFKALDAELGLRERGYGSVVACALGYRAEGDTNAKLPKSRLPEDVVFTRL